MISWWPHAAPMAGRSKASAASPFPAIVTFHPETARLVWAVFISTCRCFGPGRHACAVFIPLFVLIAMPLMLVGCVSMALPKVSARTPAAAALPALDGTSRADWEAGRAALLQQFQDEVYGAWPAREDVRLVEHEVIATDAYDGAGRIEQYTLEMGGARHPFWPSSCPIKSRDRCRRSSCRPSAAMSRLWAGARGLKVRPRPHAQTCEEGGFASFTVRQIFGRHIMTPAGRGTFSPTDMRWFSIIPVTSCPNANGPAQTALAALSPEAPSGGCHRLGLGLFPRHRCAGGRFRALTGTAWRSWGHSRNGKSALVAAAFDDRIDLVIAHQAGTGGTTLTRSDAR